MPPPSEGRAQAWARLKFSIIGPLLASPPGARELAGRINAMASQVYRHPTTGDDVRFGKSTIERWYYQARDAADPMSVLRPRARRDRGTQPAVHAEIAALLVEQHQANPTWTLQLLYDNAAVLVQQRGLPSLPSYPTMVRFMRSRGLRRRPKAKPMRPGEAQAVARKEAREVRSFEVGHVHALWHLDFHEASCKLTTPGGERMAPRMLCVIDDCSRLVCHAQWYWTESAECLVHGLTQAMLKRGLPRALLSDNGAAMTASETTRGLAQLGVLHETTLPYSPYQNGKQEVFWAQVEGRLLAMVGDTGEMTLTDLNDTTLAWVEMEYQRATHRELHGQSPRAKAMEGPSVARPCPAVAELRRAFTQQDTRVIRRSDGTISLEGKRFEVPARLRTLQKLTVRYARWDLGCVWAVDPHADSFLAPLHPLDKRANADRKRRVIGTPDGAAPPVGPASPSGPAPLLQELVRQYAATGIPPAYMPSPESTELPA